ncbi:metallophosphoesterase [Aliikangiella sp. IMCC44359]|uniref:metallophosphoesterase n=1 Tax=Aliikangiella sp. IMCC44359 TaxID=3459125 RepID=UPI00403B00FD
MKIQLLSDLHLEFKYYSYPKTDADVVVLAGDIHTKERGVKWAMEEIKDKPVVYILGNHEFYGKSYPKLIDSLKILTKNTNVHVLENNLVNIDGVNFLGCTLWTDFELFGNARISGYECQQVMTDYKKIRRSPSFAKLRSIDTAIAHSQSIKWLAENLKEKQGETNVIVTHHAPSLNSVEGKCHKDTTTAAYISNLEDFIEKNKPDYWLHGHLHNSSDYILGKCRVLCNSKGYPDSINPEYNPSFCFSI